MKKVSCVPLVHSMIIAIGAVANRMSRRGSGVIVNSSGSLRSNVQSGSVFAVQHSLTAAGRDAAVHEAGIGQLPPFAKC